MIARRNLDETLLVVSREVVEALYGALDDCQWELNELDNETHGQREARVNAEWALALARGE